MVRATRTVVRSRAIALVTRWALCVAIAVLAIATGYVRIGSAALAQDVSHGRFASVSTTPVCEERDAAPNLTDAVAGVGLVLAARPPTEAESAAPPRPRGPASSCTAPATVARSAWLATGARATTTAPHDARLRASSSARNRARLMVFLI